MTLINRIFFLLLWCVFGGFSTASARHLTGMVIDSVSREPLVGVTVELLSAADSTSIRSVVTSKRDNIWFNSVGYDIDVENNTSYILRFSMLGYKTVCKRVDVKMSDRVNEQWVENVLLAEDTKLLDEVVVKATKIKMVLRGDTLVYDASAFNLSKGSMLDALIRQMPGTTLENGVIKVNGRAVTSLLVDGRDFFKGDAKTALENLPAYTVDNIKAYDKSGKASRLMGRDMNDKEFVLDVSLKKEYRHGMMANIDLAGGSDRRYGSKFYSMFYTKRSRLTLIGAMNNVGDRGTPGEDDAPAFRPEVGGGLTATKTVGANYRHEGETEDDFAESSLNMTFTDNETLTRTTSQTFLTGGDYFGLSRRGQRGKNTTLSWSGDAGLTSGNHLLNAHLGIDHTKNNGWGSSLSGRFNANPATFSLLDSIFLPDADRRLLAMTINRVRNDNKSHTDNTAYNITFGDRVRFGQENDWDKMLQMDGDFSYHTESSNSFALNRVDYLGEAPSVDRRNQYADIPNKAHTLNLSAYYTRVIKCDSSGVGNVFLRPSYRFTHSYNSSDYSLYRLDQLDDYTDEAYSLGVLPSTREALLRVLDTHNSYRSREHTVNHGLSLYTSFTHGDGTRRPRWSVALNLPVDVKHERLDYYRQQSYEKSRTTVFVNTQMNLNYQFNDSTGIRYGGFSYSTSLSQPSLVTLLDIRDDSNPLVLTLGNPNLKKARIHSLNFNGAIFHLRSQRIFSLELNYAVTQNAIATSIRYDKETGKTTTQQVNVNGNWNLGGRQSLGLPIDKRKQWRIDQALSAYYNNNVDLTTVEGTQSVRSDVHNWNFSGSLSLQYQQGDRLRLYTTAQSSYQRATGDRPDFQKVSAWTFVYGLGGNGKLPWGLEFSTDLNQYSRRGYNDEQMNTNELVWNARLTKLMMHERLSLSLHGYDILGNLNSNTFSIDAQGRTETWTNSTTRYFMLHLAYKFNLGMKKPADRRSMYF